VTIAIEPTPKVSFSIQSESAALGEKAAPRVGQARPADFFALLGGPPSYQPERDDDSGLAMQMKRIASDG
jgi:hypothetical protein